MHAIALTAKVSRDDLAKANANTSVCVLAALALLGRFEFKQPRLRHSYTRLCFTRSPMRVCVSGTLIC